MYPVSPKMSDEEKRYRGLYDKFEVLRTDGRDNEGEKHFGCRYFILDLNHDPHARVAILAYANSCEADYPRLARDLRLHSQKMPLPGIEDLRK